MAKNQQAAIAEALQKVQGISAEQAAQVYAAIKAAESEQAKAERERREAAQRYVDTEFRAAFTQNVDLDGLVSGLGAARTSEDGKWTGWGTPPYLPLTCTLADGTVVAVKVTITKK